MSSASHKLSSLRFVEQKGGRIVEILAKGEQLEFAPLNFQQFREFYTGTGEATLQIKNPKVLVDGCEWAAPDARTKIDFNLQKKGSMLDYGALVPGGWLPANIAQADIFLPDANVACNLGDFKKDIAHRVARESDALDTGARFFNSLLPAIEGNKGTFPTLDEIATRSIEVSKKLHRAFPGRVAALSSEKILACYRMVQGYKETWERDRAYLRSMWPIIQSMRTKKGDAERAVDALTTARLEAGVAGKSFLNLLVLDALFEGKQSRKHWCPGSAVLKPHLPPTDANLYNARSDIWMLETAMQIYSLFPDQKVAICTKDRGLIGAWAMLAPHSFRSQHTQPYHRLQCTISFPLELGESMPEALRTRLFSEFQGK